MAASPHQKHLFTCYTQRVLFQPSSVVCVVFIWRQNRQTSSLVRYEMGGIVASQSFSPIASHRCANRSLSLVGSRASFCLTGGAEQQQQWVLRDKRHFMPSLSFARDTADCDKQENKSVRGFPLLSTQIINGNVGACACHEDCARADSRRKLKK